MAKFFVGQRVRMVRPVHQENLGKEYVITWFFDERQISDGTLANCKIEPSRHDQYSHTSRLEPILDPGATPSVFSYEELMEGLRSGELVAP